MFIIGLTGKSGSGKTEICEALSKKLKCKLIRFDKIGHLVTNQPAVLNKLISHFGEQILNEDGSLDRKKLGTLVFSDKKNMKILTELTLPQMIKCATLKIVQRKNNIIILDYILLPLLPFWEKCDLKILITCPQKLRFQRVKERDKISLDYIKKRESASINYSAYKFDKKYKNLSANDFDFIIEDICNEIKEGLFTQKSRK